MTLAYCWAHLRRRFYEIANKGPAPIASQALARIQTLYEIEEEIRGRPPEERCSVRQAKSRPEVEKLKAWFEDCLKRLSKASPVRDAMNYGLNQWNGLVRFLEDGRIEIDSNTVERSIRPIALSRKNSLFAGHDQGARNWARIASFVETCKAQWRQPARLAKRCADQAHQPLASKSYRRTHALDLCHCRYPVIRAPLTLGAIWPCCSAVCC